MASLKEKAAELKIAADPQDLMVLMGEEISKGIKVEDDGKVSGVDEALKALAEGKPWLIGSEKSKNIGGPSNGKSNESGDEAEEGKKIAEARNKDQDPGEDSPGYVPAAWN